MTLKYDVDVMKLGLVSTIKLIRQTIPASIDFTGSRLIVKIDPVDAQLLADTLNEKGIEWTLPVENRDGLKR